MQTPEAREYRHTAPGAVTRLRAYTLALLQAVHSPAMYGETPRPKADIAAIIRNTQHLLFTGIHIQPFEHCMDLRDLPAGASLLGRRLKISGIPVCIQVTHDILRIQVGDKEYEVPDVECAGIPIHAPDVITNIHREAKGIIKVTSSSSLIYSVEVTDEDIARLVTQLQSNEKTLERFPLPYYAEGPAMVAPNGLAWLSGQRLPPASIPFRRK
ncbi:MAG: hypothetical protein JWM56_741 [Candidatus Peribacteria bacterium]|nr:hypothetical protein [Candidatus Peribacteria bacterium]